MRALLWTDMEGISGVTDHRPCWPAFPEYWETGRLAFTDEVVSAATGAPGRRGRTARAGCPSARSGGAAMPSRRCRLRCRRPCSRSSHAEDGLELDSRDALDGADQWRLEGLRRFLEGWATA